MPAVKPVKVPVDAPVVLTVGPLIVYDTAAVLPDTFADAVPLFDPGQDTGVLPGELESPHPGLTVKIAVHVFELPAASVTVRVMV